MFLRQIIEAFFVRTEPASSMVNPAAIHMTSAPQIRKEKVLKIKTASSSTPAASATAGRKINSIRVAIPVAAIRVIRRLRLKAPTIVFKELPPLF